MLAAIELGFAIFGALVAWALLGALAWRLIMTRFRFVALGEHDDAGSAL